MRSRLLAGALLAGAVALAALGLGGCYEPPPTPPALPATFAGPQADPVLFLHGAGGELGPDTFQTMKESLRATPAWADATLDSSPLVGTSVLPIEQLAALFRPRVLAAAASSSSGQVDLVGHSLGGIVIRYLVVTDATVRAIVDDVVTLAAPHHGSLTSLMDWPALRQVNPTTPEGIVFYLALGTDVPGPVRWTTIRGANDLAVVPHDSASLGSDPDVACNHVVSYGMLFEDHFDMLYSPDSLELVARGLYDGALPPEPC